MSQAGSTLEESFDARYLYVMHSSASDAKDMVMRLDVTVITRKIVQDSDLARLSHFAELLQNPMDRGQRDVGMSATHGETDIVGARMVFRSEQGAYNREPLRCDRNPALTTPRDELVESLNGIPFTRPSIH